MASTCNILNPLQRDGTSQRQRLLEALSPTSVLIDGRDLGDLLLYVRHYASFLRYYTTSNSSGGNWFDFIDNDITTLVAVIRDTGYPKKKEKFERQKTLALTSEGPAQIQAFEALFPLTFDVMRLVDGWIRHSIPGLALHAALLRLLDSVLQDVLQDLLASAQRAKDIGLSVEVPGIQEFASQWKLAPTQSDSSFIPSGQTDKVEDLVAAVARLARLFEQAYESLVFLVSHAESYLQETLEHYPKHQPHMALFLAFLKIFEYAQDHLNSLTAKHLDFYYQEVLGIPHRDSVPDQVHIVFELAKNVADRRHVIKEDTRLKAGKDEQGIERTYAIDSELVVNEAMLSEEHGVKGVFVDVETVDDQSEVLNIYAAPKANSADGKGAEIPGEEKKWKAFGGEHWPYAEIGFALASPMFLLSEGKRTITLNFKLADHLVDDKPGTVIVQELHQNVEVVASGEKQWVPVTIQQVEITDATYVYRSDPKNPKQEFDGGEARLTFTLCLEDMVEPIVGYDDSVLTGGFETSHPILKFLLKNDGLSAHQLYTIKAPVITEFTPKTPRFDHGALVRIGRNIFRSKVPIPRKGLEPQSNPALWEKIQPSYPYKYFQKMSIKDVVISVSVTGMRSLLLENDVGVLDPAKPFHAFGPLPRKNSSFLVGHHEIFRKNVKRVDLAVEWADLPEVNFKAHYAEYKKKRLDKNGDEVKDKQGKPVYDSIIKGNQDFTVNACLLSGGDWDPVSDVKLWKSNDWQSIENAMECPLFTPQDAVSVPDSTIRLRLDNLSLDQDPTLEPFDRFATTLKQGFLKLQLNRSFLHSDYLRVLADAAKTEGADIPNAPYTPLMVSLVLNYEAQGCLEYSTYTKDHFPERVERFYHLGPFGKGEVYPIADDPSAIDVPINRKFVPEFLVTDKTVDTQPPPMLPARGTVYIGLEKLRLPQNLSLLIQVAEGSEDPKLDPPTVVWSYLTTQGWVDFLQTEIITDSTNGLLTSGIVKFSLPNTMVNEGTLMPKGPHWIKASVHDPVAAVPQFIALHPQAAVASFRDNNNDPGHLAQPLRGGTISKMQVREAPIKTVSQPYASFGGRMKETDDAYYIRVSERLRHKERAVTIFDYERLVLEHFPEVYKVKCVNHTSDETEYAPGHICIVVVPNLRNKNAVNPLEPLLSLNVRDRIRSFLALKASNFVTIEVVNPEYEKIHVDFDIRFQPGKDKGFYANQLNKDIIRYLSPWLYDNVADLIFGGQVHRSSILNFIEELDYVDFLINFQMDHWRADGSRKLNVEVAEASSSRAALVSADQHSIRTDVESCEDTPVVKKPKSPSLPSAPAPSPPILPPGLERYLGNRLSREFHDLMNLKPQCQVDEIDEDRRIYFTKTQQATAMGYDFCGHCFSRGLSKR